MHATRAPRLVGLFLEQDQCLATHSPSWVTYPLFAAFDRLRILLDIRSIIVETEKYKKRKEKTRKKKKKKKKEKKKKGRATPETPSQYATSNNSYDVVNTKKGTNNKQTGTEIEYSSEPLDVSGIHIN